MKTSTDRILTTHVGSLARPTELLDTMKEKEHGRPYDQALFDQQVTEAVADRVRKQVENGIDIVTDGEMSKVSFLGYVKDRLGGFEVEEGGSGPAPSWQAEIDMFPEYYADYMGKYSAAVAPLRRIIARGPVSYVGHDLLQIDIDNLKAAVAAVKADGYEVADVFMPSSGPSGFGRNEYYPSNSEYLEAVGEAMREEYMAIVDAGFILQVDDPWLIELLTESVRSWEECVELAQPARRGPQPRAARHPDRQGPPPHVLRPQPRAAPHRRADGQGRAVHAEDQRRRLLVRGRQPAPPARVQGVGRRRPARTTAC